LGWIMDIAGAKIRLQRRRVVVMMVDWSLLLVIRSRCILVRIVLVDRRPVVVAVVVGI
jgi:hypothetical protein